MNKFLISILAAIPLACVAQEETHEIRWVAGVKVDLMPVYNWQRLPASEQKKTERPMPHWKRISISAVKGRIGSWDQCIVSNEQGRLAEVLINNLPGRLRDSVSKLAQLKQNFESTASTIAALRSRAADQPSGSVSATDMLQRAEALQRELFRIGDERDGVSYELRLMTAQPLFAMSTGRRYSGLEVWDCGEVR